MLRYDPARDDDPHTVAQTEASLDDADRVLEDTRTSRESFDAMLALHPDRLDPGALRGGAVALLADG